MEHLLARALHAHHPETLAHGLRVGSLAVQLGQSLGSRSEDLSVFWRAGVFHDTGKLALSPATLDKKAALTEEEFQAIRRHIHVGASLLKMARVPRGVREAALLHHERTDCSGYLGFDLNQLSEVVRVVAVADTYDCLTHDRSYQAAVTPEEALDIVRLQAFPPPEIEALERVLVGSGSSEGEEGDVWARVAELEDRLSERGDRPHGRRRIPGLEKVS